MKLFEYFQHLGAFRTLIQTRDIANGAITPDKLSKDVRMCDCHFPIGTKDIEDGAITPKKLSKDVPLCNCHYPLQTKDIGDGTITPDKLSKEVFDHIPTPYMVMTQDEYDNLQTITKDMLYIIVERKETEPSEPVTTTWKFGDPFPIILT